MGQFKVLVQALRAFVLKYRWFMLAAVVLVVVVIVVSIFLHNATDTAQEAFIPKPSETQKDSPQPNSDAKAPAEQVLCARTSGALYCRASGQADDVRLALPKVAAKAAKIIPSPDGQRYLVVSPPNPITPKQLPTIVITDTRFNVQHTITESSARGASDIAWAANDNYLLYSQPDSKGSKLYVYDIAKNQPLRVGSESYKASRPQLTTDGSLAYLTSLEGGGSIISVQTAGGQASEMNISAVSDKLSRVNAMVYDAANNVWFVSGIGKTGKPLVITMELKNGAATVKKIIDDGSAYTLQAVSSAGVAATRVSEDGTTNGVIRPNAEFVPLLQQPSQVALFVSAQLPQLTRLDADTAATHVYEYVDVPDGNASRFIRSLATKQCEAGSYAQIDVLGRVGTNQLATLETPCGSQLSLRHYYIFSSGTYTDVLQVPGAPECDAIRAVGIDRQLAPDCIENDDHGDTEGPGTNSAPDMRLPPPARPNGSRPDGTTNQQLSV